MKKGRAGQAEGSLSKGLEACVALCMWERPLGAAKAKSDGKISQLETLDHTLEGHECQAKT